MSDLLLRHVDLLIAVPIFRGGWGLAWRELHCQSGMIDQGPLLPLYPFTYPFPLFYPFLCPPPDPKLPALTSVNPYTCSLPWRCPFLFTAFWFWWLGLECLNFLPFMILPIRLCHYPLLEIYSWKTVLVNVLESSIAHTLLPKCLLEILILFSYNLYWDCDGFHFSILWVL